MSMVRRTAKPQPLTGTDERQPARENTLPFITMEARRGLIEYQPLEAFKTFSQWQCYIRWTVDLEVLQRYYAELKGPCLNEVAGSTPRTDELDRCWMRSWIYYQGSLQHLMQIAQPTHWREYGSTKEVAIQRVGGIDTLHQKWAQLRYDRPAWDLTKKEVTMAVKEKKKAVKEKKAAVAAEKANRPMGFRAGTPMATVAEILLKEGKITYEKLSKIHKYPSDFINFANKRGFKVTYDKEAGVVTLSK